MHSSLRRGADNWAELLINELRLALKWSPLTQRGMSIYALIRKCNGDPSKLQKYLREMDNIAGFNLGGPNWSNRQDKP